MAELMWNDHCIDRVISLDPCYSVWKHSLYEAFNRHIDLPIYVKY